MSQRKFIFRGGSRELVLPVTPESYRVEKGNNVEVVNIHELGDAVLVGRGTLCTIQISCLFPARGYAFSRDSGAEDYVEQFERWVKKRQKLRFIVGNTGVNLPVVVQSIAYGERDGTNDIYADITLREYRQLKAVRTAATPSSGKPRTPMEKEAGSAPTDYPVPAGETMSSLARNLLGNAAAGHIVQENMKKAKIVGGMVVQNGSLNVQLAIEAKKAAEEQP